MAVTMQALTVRQPWAWAIIHAGKDVENRTWTTNHRGPLAIHAATKFWRGGGDEMRVLAGIQLPPDEHLILGAVIGVVDLVDVVADHDSRWAADQQWHWVLANPRPITPVGLRGQPGLFRITI